MYNAQELINLSNNTMAEEVKKPGTATPAPAPKKA